MLALSLQMIEKGMFLVTSIGYHCMAWQCERIYKGPFRPLVISKANF